MAIENAFRRAVLIAVALGLARPVFDAILLALPNPLPVLMVNATVSLGYAYPHPTSHFLIWLMNTTAFAIIYGVVFGVPLGLASRKDVFAAWGCFTLASLISLLAVAIYDLGVAPGIENFASCILFVPEQWLFLLCIGLVAIAIARVSRGFAERAVAP